MCRKRSRKQFSPLWRSCEASARLFKYGNVQQSRFNHCEGPVKHVYAYLCAGKDRESSFHLFGGHVKLVQGCLSAGNVQQSRFNHCGGPVKLV